MQKHSSSVQSMLSLVSTSPDLATQYSVFSFRPPWNPASCVTVMNRPWLCVREAQEQLDSKTKRYETFSDLCLRTRALCFKRNDTNIHPCIRSFEDTSRSPTISPLVVTEGTDRFFTPDRNSSNYPEIRQTTQFVKLSIMMVTQC